jgi:hypothetical protein
MARPKKAQPNKSEFVRSMPSNAPAKDVVVAAKKTGIRLTERYVYVIRSSDKARARKHGSTRSGRSGRSNGGAEADLRRAIAELGLTQARQVLADVEAAFGSGGAVTRRSRLKSAGGRTETAAFILAQPSSTPIKAVVEAGARKGLRFSGSYVSRVRSEAR